MSTNKKYFDDKFEKVVDKLDTIYDRIYYMNSEAIINSEQQEVSKFEARCILKLSSKTIERACKNGELNKIERKSRVYFLKKDILEYKKKITTGTIAK